MNEQINTEALKPPHNSVLSKMQPCGFRFCLYVPLSYLTLVHVVFEGSSAVCCYTKVNAT